MKITFIDCTEKHHKDIDEIINFIIFYINSLGIKSDILKLNELKIARCSMCRCCTQKKSEEPVKCVIKDDLNDKLEEIEDSTKYIIFADRNHLFSKNKIHEKFSQRLIAYYYWPYGQVQSIKRKAIENKNSILINYNTTKYFLNHSFYTSKIYMQHAAHSIGAKVLDWEAITPKKDIIKSYENRLKEMINRLINSKF